MTLQAAPRAGFLAPPTALQSALAIATASRDGGRGNAFAEAIGARPSAIGANVPDPFCDGSRPTVAHPCRHFTQQDGNPGTGAARTEDRDRCERFSTNGG